MLLAMRELEYDGLNRRIRKVVSNCGDGLVPGSDDLDGNGTPDATGIPFANRSEHYYYAGWRVIEERDNNGSAGRVLAQTVYGTEYIDEPVCRDRNLDVSTDSTPAADDCLDGSGGTTGSTRYFYHQDANYRVAALTSESGTVVERYEYEAYGEPRVHVGQPAGGTYESGALVSTSYVGNPLMHQGLRRDDETGLHENRYRMLHSRLGRFMQRDPAGYVDGLNTYEALSSQMLSFVDPMGLAGSAAGGLSCGAAIARAATLAAAAIALIATAPDPALATQAALQAIRDLEDLVAIAACAGADVIAVGLRAQLEAVKQGLRGGPRTGPSPGPAPGPSRGPRPGPRLGPDWEPPSPPRPPKPPDDPRGGKCEFYKAWCEEVRDNPEGCDYAPTKLNKFGGNCTLCYAKCKASPFERWPMEDCPMGGRQGPRWPGPRDRFGPSWPD